MKLREFRLKSHLTQSELAEKIGVTKQFISEIELCKRDPSIKLLVHLAIVLNTTPNDLLDFHYDAND